MNSPYNAMFGSLCAYFDQRLEQNKEVLKAELRQESDARVEQMFGRIKIETLTMLRLWFEQMTTSSSVVPHFPLFHGMAPFGSGLGAPLPFGPFLQQANPLVPTSQTPSPSVDSNSRHQQSDESSNEFSSLMAIENDKSERETYQLPPKKRKIEEIEEEEIDVINVDEKVDRHGDIKEKAEDVVNLDDSPVEEDSDDSAKYGYHNRRNNTVTIKLKCHQEKCELQFEDKPKLLEHMLAVHKVEKFRCQVGQCGRSFSFQYQLTYHLKKAHGDITEWACSMCGNMFKKYEQMGHHIYFVHQRGLFGCAAKDCTYTDSTRKDISQHFETRHRFYKCNYPECNRKFKYTGHLSVHIYGHLNIKPYCCKWPDCDYTSDNRSHIINHIRTKHFKLPITVKEQIEKKIDDDRDPKEYLEVRDDLISMASPYQSRQKSDPD